MSQLRATRTDTPQQPRLRFVPGKLQCHAAVEVMSCMPWLAHLVLDVYAEP